MVIFCTDEKCTSYNLLYLAYGFLILLYMHTVSAYSFYICLIHYIQVKSFSDMENTFVCRFDSY